MNHALANDDFTSGRSTIAYGSNWELQPRAVGLSLEYSPMASRFTIQKYLPPSGSRLIKYLDSNSSIYRRAISVQLELCRILTARRTFWLFDYNLFYPKFFLPWWVMIFRRVRISQLSLSYTLVSSFAVFIFAFDRCSILLNVRSAYVHVAYHCVPFLCAYDVSDWEVIV